MGKQRIGIRLAGLLKFDMPSHKSNASPERSEGKRFTKKGLHAKLQQNGVDRMRRQSREVSGLPTSCDKITLNN